MANHAHYEILKHGVDAWNRWRLEKPEVVPNLSSCALCHHDLRGANLRQADLRGTNLGAAWDYVVGSSYAHMLDRGDEDEDSRGNLRGPDLREADLSGANLTGAYVKGARVGGTAFVGVDLSEVEGLAEIQHSGPSEISISTIYRSQGKIPLAFLRGAGVPDNFIEYMHSLMRTSFEFHSCFISYSTRDQEFAQRLYADLQSRGVRCWFAPHDVQAGKKLHEQIDHAIRIHEKVLLVLSPDSMNSEWVKTEIAKARKREVEQKKHILLPIRLVDFEVIRKWECFDADTGKDSAREIREYFIPDFSNWANHHSYRQAFEKLLEDLKGEKSKETAVL